MNYTEWETEISSEVLDQMLWNTQLYRITLFMTELAQRDVEHLIGGQPIVQIGTHLYETVNELKNQITIAHNFEYLSPPMIASYRQALLAARQSKDWYYKSRQSLGEEISSHRIQLLQQIILLILSRLPISESTQHIRASTAFSVIPNYLLTDIPLR